MPTLPPPDSRRPASAHPVHGPYKRYHRPSRSGLLPPRLPSDPSDQFFPSPSRSASPSDSSTPPVPLPPLPSLSAFPLRCSSLGSCDQSHLMSALNSNDSSHPASRCTTASPSVDQASAHHVRQVYAFLDRVGVPGDGYADGVERTREHRRLSALFNRSSAQPDRSHQGSDLTDSELQVLRCADRYGFFKRRASERVVSLDAAAFYPAPGSSPKPQIIHRSPSSLGSSSSQSACLKSSSSKAVIQKETSRIEKWTEMIVSDRRDLGSNILSYRLNPDWESQRVRFENRCFKGIPDRWRRAAWEMLMIEFEDKARFPNRSPVDRLRSQFCQALEAPSEQDIQIDLDVPRTINGHIFFHTRYGRGQRALFQVLHAFGMHCTTCGYCQGMGPIAATLLSYFDAETAFICMVRIHDSYGYHSVFAPGFPGLLECFYIQEKLIEFLIPSLHKIFQQQMISTSAFATKWYITLFANTVSYEAQLRLWDVFFLKGIDILILASVSIIYSLKSTLDHPKIDFEQILSNLGGTFEIPDPSSWIRSIKKLSKRVEIQSIISRSRADWKQFVLDGSAPRRVT